MNVPRELIDLAREVYVEIRDRGEVFLVDDVKAEVAARVGARFSPEQVERAVATIDAVEYRDRQTPEEKRAEFEKLKPYFRSPNTTYVQAVAAYLQDHPGKVRAVFAEAVERKLRDNPAMTWTEAAIELLCPPRKKP